MRAFSKRWDIFCKVVDNYGDAGVCWRLARQLAAEHGLAVTLWLDEPAALARIEHGVDGNADEQIVRGVAIRRWREPFAIDADRKPPEVVIEAFGCGLPAAFVDVMSSRAPPPQWFVLEYLSAEGWIEGSHGLSSPHPRLPLGRRFWFPGFTPRTGGLLREHGLVETRVAFRSDVSARNALWSSMNLPPPTLDELRISLFCYPNPELPALLDAWSDGDTPVTLIVPEGVAMSALDRWTGGGVPHAGNAVHRGRLDLHVVPFASQDDYDRLLWACDVNFVRGEDSFVRAQWAATPFVWHIYPQAEDAHRAKLDAFIARFGAGLDASAANAMAAFWRGWNGFAGAPPPAEAWNAFAAALPALAWHGEAWASHLSAETDLASVLVKASRNRL